MSGAIFLSASVPDPRRGPEFAKTADTVAITAAVASLVYVTLGRRLLVWGGHPAITPMILVVANDMGLEYGTWVKLYQSDFFKDEFPEDNAKFKNVVYASRKGDREASLKLMRRRMFKENKFDAAIFIGGMKGVFDEFDLFRALQPKSVLLPIASTGGAALELAGTRILSQRPDLASDLDYVSLFHRNLDISVKERRYTRRDEQPADISSRMWDFAVTPRPKL